MALIKHRDGYSGRGRQTANYMAESDAPHSQRTRGNVRIKKNGDLINIRGGDEEEVTVDSALFSLGMVGPVGNGPDADWNLASTYINGARDLHRFAQLRDVPSFAGRGVYQYAGPIALERSVILHYRKGKLGLIQLDFNDAPEAPRRFDEPADTSPRYCANYKINLYTGRTAKSLSLRYSLVGAITPEGGGSAATIQPPTFRMAGDAPSLWSSAAFVWISSSSGQVIPGLVLDDGVNLTVSPTLHYQNEIAVNTTTFQLSPDSLLKVDWYARPLAPAPETTTSNGLLISFTPDAGASWIQATNDIFTSELATLKALPDTEQATFNSGVAGMTLNVAPVSTTSALVLATVPYWNGTELQLRIKLGQLTHDADSCHLSATTTLFDGDLFEPDGVKESDWATSGLYRVHQFIPFDGGALLVKTTQADPWPPVACADIEFYDGSTLTHVAKMPYPMYRTGPLIPLSKTTIGSVMWVDGKAVLHTSKDKGVTWKPKFTVAEADDPLRQLMPTSIGGVIFYRRYRPFMVDWSQLAITKLQDKPAAPAPQIPWLHDARVKGPE